MLFLVPALFEEEFQGGRGQRGDLEDAGGPPLFIDLFAVRHLFGNGQLRRADGLDTVGTVGIEVGEAEDPTVVHLHLVRRPGVERQVLHGFDGFQRQRASLLSFGASPRRQPSGFQFLDDRLVHFPDVLANDLVDIGDGDERALVGRFDDLTQLRQFQSGDDHIEHLLLAGDEAAGRRDGHCAAEAFVDGVGDGRRVVRDDDDLLRRVEALFHFVDDAGGDVVREQ